MKKLKSWIAGFLILGAMGLMGFGLFTLRREVSRLRLENYAQSSQIEAVKKQVPEMAQYMLLVQNLQKASRGKLTAYQVAEISRVIIEQCYANQDIGFTPAIVLGVIERESRFNPKAVSKARAFGLMQVIQLTFEGHLADLGYGRFTKDLALDPIVNVQVGIRELVRLRRYWLAEGVDDWIVAANSYFWGVRLTWALLQNKRRSWLPSLEYGRGVLLLARAWEAKGL
jgi:soluble lytic murein transglycosylase-like protein